MKLNKKLLTAALAGALIVTAIPAGTFADHNKAEDSYTYLLNLSKEQAAAKIAEYTAIIKEKSARRAEIVTQPFNPDGTSEGLIEKLQKEEAAAKAKYEAAKAKYEAAEKALTKAKDNEEKARLNLIKVNDAFDAKYGEYQAAVAKAKGEYEAAKEKAQREYDTVIANSKRKSEDAKVAYDKTVADKEAAQKALDAAVEAGSEAGHITELRLILEQKTQAEAKAKLVYDAELAKIDDVVNAAKATQKSAFNTAKNAYDAEINRLNKKYKLSDGWNESAAELTKARREIEKATKAYEAAQAGTVSAQKAYDSALEGYKTAKKAYAAANQKTYKVAEELKTIEKTLKENYTKINVILADQNKSINDLAGQLSAETIKALQDWAKLSGSEQADAIAKLQEELNKLKEEYNKTKDEIKEVKSVYTYKFAVKDTTGKGVQGLTLTFTNIEDTSKVYAATSDENGDIIVKGIVEGTYKITITTVPTGYKVVQKGKMVSEVKGLFRPEAEVKAENNVEEISDKKDEAKDKEIEIPEYVTIKGGKEDKKEEKDDEKVIEGGTIVVEKEKDNEKKPEDNKKPEKEDNKKPAKPAKKVKKQLPKAGAAAEAATIAAAAMATMGGAYLSLKKRK